MTGTQVFYRTGFALRCAVSFYLVTRSVFSFLIIPFTIGGKCCTLRTYISIIGCIVQKLVCVICGVNLFCSAVAFRISYKCCNAFFFTLLQLFTHMVSFICFCCDFSLSAWMPNSNFFTLIKFLLSLVEKDLLSSSFPISCYL